MDILKSSIQWLSRLGRLITVYTLALAVFTCDFTTTQGILTFLFIPIAIGFSATFFNSLREHLDGEEALLFSCLGGLFATSLLWKYGNSGIICSICALPVFIPLAIFGGFVGLSLGDYLRVHSTFRDTV